MVHLTSVRIISHFEGSLYIIGLRLGFAVLIQLRPLVLSAPDLYGNQVSAPYNGSLRTSTTESKTIARAVSTMLSQKAVHATQIGIF